jgi:hypothetical protein
MQDYIRLVIIIGAYCLLRPYLLKLAGRFQAKDHEREIDANELSSGAAMNPNSLRGQVMVPDDTDSEGEATGAEWGKRAKKRQRQLIRKILDADEKRKLEEQEAEDDKDIAEFLVD